MKRLPILTRTPLTSNAIGIILATTLLLFTLRRWLFLLASNWSSRGNTPLIATNTSPPSLLLLLPLRNEAHRLPPLLSKLHALDFPPDALTVVLIDDASTDGTVALCQPWVDCLTNWHLLHVEQNMGKAAVLNLALTQFPMGDFIAVFDADERPYPHTLAQLTRPFANGRIAAVTGRRRVSNPLASWIASYATFENIVHQLITVQGKDRLQLAPPSLGSNCVYRRTALAQVGNFKAGALLEDSDLTIRLARAGWQTCFLPQAVSEHAVPHTLRSYWQQRTRWAGGFQHIAQDETQTRWQKGGISWFLRWELWAFSLGYLDRLAFLWATVWIGWKTAVSHRPPTLLTLIWLLAFCTPFLQTIVALQQSNASRSLWRRLFLLPLFFPLDVASALVGIYKAWHNHPILWKTQEQQPFYD